MKRRAFVKTSSCSIWIEMRNLVRLDTAWIFTSSPPLARQTLLISPSTHSSASSEDEPRHREEICASDHVAIIDGDGQIERRGFPTLSSMRNLVRNGAARWQMTAK